MDRPRTICIIMYHIGGPSRVGFWPHSVRVVQFAARSVRSCLSRRTAPTCRTDGPERLMKFNLSKRYRRANFSQRYKPKYISIHIRGSVSGRKRRHLQCRYYLSLGQRRARYEVSFDQHGSRRRREFSRLHDAPPGSECPVRAVCRSRGRRPDAARRVWSRYAKPLSGLGEKGGEAVLEGAPRPTLGRVQRVLPGGARATRRRVKGVAASSWSCNRRSARCRPA
jgi:hypothetical protein